MQEVIIQSTFFSWVIAKVNSAQKGCEEKQLL